jgi:hypothetical protein
VQDAWQLSSPQEAIDLLGGDAGTLGANVAAPAATPRPASNIDAVAADAASLNHLSAARDRVIANTAQKLGGTP